MKNLIANFPVDSLGKFDKIIVKAKYEIFKTNNVCDCAIKDFMNSNPKNSLRLNNTILYLHFQSFLKREIFNELEAYKIAKDYEIKKAKLR